RLVVADAGHRVAGSFLEWLSALLLVQLFSDLLVQRRSHDLLPLPPRQFVLSQPEASREGDFHLIFTVLNSSPDFFLGCAHREPSRRTPAEFHLQPVALPLLARFRTGERIARAVRRIGYLNRERADRRRPAKGRRRR